MSNPNNHWHLYDDIKGWEFISHKLDAAFGKISFIAVRTLKAGGDPLTAGAMMYYHMEDIMQSTNGLGDTGFGATSRNSLLTLVSRICDQLKLSDADFIQYLKYTSTPLS